MGNLLAYFDGLVLDLSSTSVFLNSSLLFLEFSVFIFVDSDGKSRVGIIGIANAETHAKGDSVINIARKLRFKPNIILP